MNDVKINVRGKEMLLSTRVKQYSTNLLGLYHTSKSMEHVEMMLENFKDYDVDSNEEDLKIQIENIFADKGDLEHDADCKCLDDGWGQAALQHPCSDTRHTAL